MLHKGDASLFALNVTSSQASVTQSGRAVILRTTDGGATWSAVPSGSTANCSVCTLQPTGASM